MHQLIMHNALFQRLTDSRYSSSIIYIYISDLIFNAVPLNQYKSQLIIRL